MQSRICEMLDIEFPLLAFSHCRDVVVAVSKAGGMGVFGAVNFRDGVLSCIDFLDYFLGAEFGVCVDRARGVFFEEGGGFGSSLFAEIYYLGVWGVLLISISFGFSLSLLQSAYLNLRCSKLKDINAGILVFFLTPNLVYFARSSALDFIGKFVEVLMMMMILLIIKRVMIKRVEF
mgnify:CR=1 FL=1